MTPEAESSSTVTGRVVRIVDNAEDSSGMWPHHLGIEFELTVHGLDALLEDDIDSWSNNYLIDLERGAE